MGKYDPRQDLWSKKKWTKAMIDDTGCPYVSQHQMLVRNACLMPYYQLNESPDDSNFTVAVSLEKADVLEVDEANNKLFD